MALPLLNQTPEKWIDVVLKEFDTFLVDHAQAEKKAAGMAISMLTHYPDKVALVKAMADLAVEEMAHFREVIKLMQKRSLQLCPDEKDPYVNALRNHIRKGKEHYMLDRLIIASIIEARGCERFGLIGEYHTDIEMKEFYRQIAESEGNHYELFIDLAKLYFENTIVDQRMEELLNIEANIISDLPIRAALH